MFRQILVLFIPLFLWSTIVMGAEKDTLLLRIEKIKSPRKQVKELNSASERCWKTGQYSKGLIYAKKGLVIARKHHYKKIESILLDNVGIIYDYKGNYPQALKNLFDALKIQEDIKYESGEAYTLSNIGLIYGMQGKNSDALIFHKRSLAIRKKIKDKGGQSASYNNIGICYLNDKNYSKALSYFQKSKALDEKMKDDIGLMDDLNNIGLCYMNTNQIDQAIEVFKKCLSMRVQYGDLYGAATAHNNIGTCYMKQEKDYEAEKEFMTGLDIAKSIGTKETILYSYENLYVIYSAKKDFKKAFEYLQLATQEKNELTNANAIREETETELNYQFAKKTEADKMRQVKKDTENQERRKQSIMLIWSMVIIVVIVGIFSIFLYRRWKLAQEQREIIEIQRHEVQEKNNEIVDSINYAQRIQSAILPSEEVLEKELTKHALFFQPKDIVAGDFYWTHSKEDTVFFAVADCTGHGVPGAFMSLLCHNALNRSILEYNCMEPGKILNQARDIIVTEFAKSQLNLRDGMDISLCAWNKTTNVCTWAGANNPLWILPSQSDELVEIKGDKQPVGNHHQFVDFTTHLIPLEKGTRFFLFSDGIADQFGGPVSKKYKSKRLKDLILKTRHSSIESQLNELAVDFKEWKGSFEQIDDVCMLIVEF